MENERQRQTYYGALNYQNKEFIVQGKETGNSQNTISFIEYSRSIYPGCRLALIWDGASYHKSKEMQEYLKSINHGLKKEEWEVTCILFAPNAPEQNPVEDIWLQAKNFIRRYYHLCKDFKAVKILFEFFTNRQKFNFPKLHTYGIFS